MFADAQERRDRRLTRWTSTDVYEPPRMAPRAGFEIERKLLSAQVMRASPELNTPGGTPRVIILTVPTDTRSRARVLEAPASSYLSPC
jgi:hypothetical protein